MILKDELNNLSIEEQVEHINLYLGEYSLTKLSEEIGISRSTITKRFKKIGYIFDKGINKFIRNEDTERHQEALQDTVNINTLLNELNNLKKRVELLENNYNTTNKLQNNSDDTMIKFYNGADTVRSLRIDYEVWEQLKDFMSKNKQYRQKDIISSMIDEFLSKYNK